MRSEYSFDSSSFELSNEVNHNEFSDGQCEVTTNRIFLGLILSRARIQSLTGFLRCLRSLFWLNCEQKLIRLAFYEIGVNIYIQLLILSLLKQIKLNVVTFQKNPSYTSGDNFMQLRHRSFNLSFDSKHGNIHSSNFFHQIIHFYRIFLKHLVSESKTLSPYR